MHDRLVEHAHFSAHELQHGVRGWDVDLSLAGGIAFAVEDRPLGLGDVEVVMKLSHDPLAIYIDGLGGEIRALSPKLQHAAHDERLLGEATGAVLDGRLPLGEVRSIQAGLQVGLGLAHPIRQKAGKHLEFEVFECWHALHPIASCGRVPHKAAAGPQPR